MWSNKAPATASHRSRQLCVEVMKPARLQVTPTKPSLLGLLSQLKPTLPNSTFSQRKCISLHKSILKQDDL